MTRFGYFLSSEEYDPASLIKQAKMAERAGFDALWIPDHFHPWLDEQGQSSFVWSVIGAISQATTCGPDPEPYLQAIRAYQEAGFDEVYVGQVGGRLEGAFEFFATQVLPRVRET